MSATSPLPLGGWTGRHVPRTWLKLPGAASPVHVMRSMTEGYTPPALRATSPKGEGQE